MKLLLATLLISQSAFAIDAGDGSDGVCNITGGAGTQITSAKKYYQCSSLNIDANLDDFKGSQAGAGGAALVIKVQGNVTVVAGVTVDLSGDNGLAGNTTAGVKAGGVAGAGGFSGGAASGLNLDGVNGSGAGGGLKGLQVDQNLLFSYGGGGGGGSYKTQGITLSVDGEDVGGNGTSNGSGGAQGFVYGDEATFETSFTGGSGGAGGGGGQENGQSDISGSSGGGGGGALHIIAGGNITVDGSIISRGGNGGGIAATQFAGGGGAGSGGAIWLQAGGNLIVSASGTITSLGGTQGTNDGGYDGGNGGDGRIRLDDGDGVITMIGGSTVSPAPYSTSFTPTPITSGTSAINRQYASGVSCASVALGDEEKPFNNLMNLILGLGIAGLAHYLVSKKSKV
ncbi:hypothetical protein SHI21_11640 [Bacteriovorax sp. PP10]|uniref:Uncharacterized protein n=1 Tax=Bacteriovorax antarcticus TaxID=3088717 RepID=A0ABU5VZ56_9BACT|nr:hypothetical protein [Bacteriovorax sp. PP10]MEA9356865.1 hypothetical protein [Bacteriovorax sp. PP10]